MAAFITNAVQFECLKDVQDNEGRFVLIKGKLENRMVTMINELTIFLIGQGHGV